MARSDAGINLVALHNIEAVFFEKCKYFSIKNNKI